VIVDLETQLSAGGRHILAGIDVCGLEGPVQIIPYIDEVLTLPAAN